MHDAAPDSGLASGASGRGMFGRCQDIRDALKPESRTQPPLPLGSPEAPTDNALLGVLPRCCP